MQKPRASPHFFMLWRRMRNIHVNTEYEAKMSFKVNLQCEQLHPSAQCELWGFRGLTDRNKWSGTRTGPTDELWNTVRKLKNCCSRTFCFLEAKCEQASYLLNGVMSELCDSCASVRSIKTNRVQMYRHPPSSPFFIYMNTVGLWTVQICASLIGFRCETH